ncbi:hypothetical protein EW146_g386 [Bondarzewia mesenterica]|uniref:Uncharacterized protein n=1 Tax=Bondarzewia mesenterica TaxID=1095465 RepID=A0A4S4MDH0_9AGAM|nr:hypothetical protein EW146_g386 [Bondarzewia mesenterica]
MDEAINSDDQDNMAAPTAASILGIKGHLRLRPHGSTQKAHIVLRRVELDDDSGDEGDEKKVAYFSLFAHKRIEVKPGKEILLTVADGPFKDKAIMFEGDFPSPLASSDEEDETQVAEDDEDLMPTEHLIPPKMRKPWIKRVEESNIIQPVVTPLPTHQSIAIQTQPELATSSLQAVSIALEQISTASQTPGTDTLSDMSMQTQSSSRSDVQEATVQEIFAEPDEFSHEMSLETEQQSERERSLSPMELDSPPSSPPQSPVRTPTDLPALTSQDKSIPGLQISQDEPQINGYAPVQAPIPFRPTPPPTIPTPPYVTQGLQSLTNTMDDECLYGGVLPPKTSFSKVVGSERRAIGSQIPSKIQQSSVFHTPPTSRPPSIVQPLTISIERASSKLSQRPPLSQPSTVAPSSPPPHQPPIDEACTVHHKPIMATDDSKPIPSKMNARKKFVNPFVSGGFITEFVGLSPQPTLDQNKPRRDSPIDVSKARRDVWPPPVSVDSVPPSYHKPARMGTDEQLGRSNPVIKREDAPTRMPAVGPRSATPSTGAVQSTHAQYPSSTVPPLPKPVSQPLYSQTRNALPPTMLPYHALPPSNIPRIQPAQYKPIQPIPIPEMSVTQTRQVQQLSSQSPYGPSRTSSPSPGSNVLAAMGFDRAVWNAALLRSSAQRTQAIATPPPPPPSGPTSYRHPIFVPASSTTPNPPSPPSSSTRIPIPIPIPIHHETPQYSPLNPSFANDPLPLMITSRPEHKGIPIPQDIGSQLSQLGMRFTGPQSSSAASHPLPMKPQVLAPLPRFQRHASPIASPARTTDTRSRAAPQPPPPVSGVKRKLSPPPTPAPTSLLASAPQFPERTQPSPIRHRFFQWPTVTGMHSVHVKGDNVGIRGIVFNSTGSYFAVNCHDCTIRIFDNLTHTEVARLSHVAPVVTAVWMEDDVGIISLSENGTVSKWTKNSSGIGKKIVDAGNADPKPEDIPTSLAYTRDKFAVAFPRSGVKVWIWNRGTWQSQRSILRQNVTTIKWIEDGEALLGGTKDGVLWSCKIPNGTLRAYSFLKLQVNHIDLDSTGWHVHVLVSQSSGRTHLVFIDQDNKKGVIEQVYALKEAEQQAKATYDFGALFTSKENLILFGCIDGNVLVWDKKKAEVVCGLDHGEDVVTQAVGTYISKSPDAEHCLVTGSQNGKLTWWSQPQLSEFEESPSKRVKTS